jgi:hypothetical protein
VTAAADPLITAAQLLTKLTRSAGRDNYRFEDIAHLPATAAILKADEATQLAIVRQCVAQIGAMRKRLGKPRGEQMQMRYMNLHDEKDFPSAALQVLCRLLRKQLPFTDEDYVFLVNRTSDLEMISNFCLPYLGTLVGHLERHVKTHGLSAAMSAATARMRKALAWEDRALEMKLCRRLEALHISPASLPIQAGEAWSDKALADLGAMSAKKRAAWTALLAHCLAATGGQPSKSWLHEAEKGIDALGYPEFRQRLLSWFPLVDKPRTQVVARWADWKPNPNLMIIEPHADILKGLAWCCTRREDRDIARALTALAVSAYKKVPRVGPRAVKIGNACVYVLGAMAGMDGVGQLARLKVRVKFGTAQKGIEKALIATAERVGIPCDDLEEMAVPAYGLQEVGRLEEQMGELKARLIVTGTSATELTWIRADGKEQRSPPAAVSKRFADDLKDMRAAAKDIQQMIPAQRERIDHLYRQQKTWPFDTWRERYLDHPLVGTLARRLIWTFSTGKKQAEGIYHNGVLVGTDDRPVARPGSGTTVALWHPIAARAGDIAGWRAWLEQHQVQQPFKQAHREVYLLTDAERGTRVYSNRFAAHILKQHQFNALCGVRGWRNKLRLLVDAEFPPATLWLPRWNLRAEFWIDGVGDNYGVDTNEAGSFLYLATDQVRFYRLDAAEHSAHASGGGYHAFRPADTDTPIPVQEIPPLVFSEVMRDVDLFVGVASVGNDPNWSDGGPNGRYQDYWQVYSFGDLSATAQTRKDVLARLIPRLRIAERCSLSDKFLLVRGDLHTYKIHLGSGNILMSPNDQYLCIVPKQSAAAGSKEGLFLPFEGDNMMSIILSKALLLADDRKIKDEAIVSQIGRG